MICVKPMNVTQKLMQTLHFRVTILNNFGDSRFSERSLEDHQFLLREQERNFPPSVPPPVRIPYTNRGMPHSRGASYMDVDAPQGERDYTLPTESLFSILICRKNS